ncbi:AAA family ATPase (plasmid) [Aneurinibacillus sp. Ricciae_BoGa-3]|uniref:metallophosphoesterase n=1 Tax=Aneurinibacillus sp. Ricciae_BoGa-3 TaxID=3022697 RepID=UPI002341D332|nr:metallophosphoesterase [Aneurinibacillus sp. Ricciae_BoGa-3]WCK57703.1 AAA family ATPase [Aneurinibacillus sp. Ricciae_BoGa-3]
MKLIQFGDYHNRSTAPENRTDDFLASMNLKTEEILRLGEQYEVAAFLQPGDFWDAPNPPLDFASEVIRKWTKVDVFEILGKMMSKEKYDKELFITKYLRRIFTGEIGDIEEARKELVTVYSEEDFKKDKELVQNQLKNYRPLIGVAGNHELFGNNINTLPKTMLGFMEKLGLMRFATKENPYFLTTEDGLTVAITGTHYHLDVDSPEYLDDYIVTEKLGDIHIHLNHGYLSDKSMGNLFRHTLVDQIKHTKADLTISGHDHMGFPITQIDDKYFVNTGAIPRLKNDVREINRTVKVLLIDITKEHGLQLKEIPLKSAKPGNTVLSRTKIEEKKARASRLEEFKKTVRDAGIKKATDITEIIRDLAGNKQLPIEVRDQVIERISEKMREINQSTDGILKHARVTKAILVNFQSHAYSEFDFSNGFNLLVGESKQGKTALLRAFDWVYRNKPSGKRFIRKKAEYAKVILHLSNGYIISRFVEAKNGGKNGYEITDPKTGETSFHNTKILPEVQKILGYSPLIIDKDLQFTLNFSKQGTGWFLIGDQYSAPQKAKIIGGIYGTQYADAVIRDLDAETKKSNEKIKSAHEVLTKTKEQLQQYEYLPDLKKSIDGVEEMLKEIQRLQQQKEKIEKLLDKREQLVSNIYKNQQIVTALQDVNRTYTLLTEAKENVAKRNRLEELITKRDKTAHSLKHIYASLEAVKHLDEAKEQLHETTELHSKRNQIEKVIDKREEVLANISEQTLVITHTEQVQRASRLIENLKKGWEKRESIESCIDKRANFLENISKQNLLLEQTQRVEEAKSLVSGMNQAIQTRKELEVKVKRAVEVQEKRTTQEKALKAIAVTLEQTSRIEEAKEHLFRIKTNQQRRESIVKQLVLREKFVVLVQKEQVSIDQANAQIQKDVKIYQQVLEEAGQCPVCFGKVDNTTVNRIVKAYIKH